jgi:hypothetical protein
MARPHPVMAGLDPAIGINAMEESDGRVRLGHDV